MGVLKELKLKDLVTLCGTACGITSIVLAIDGRFPWISASFIYFAMIFDLLDGFVAKMMKQSNELGKQLDSLNDCICFGVAPAILIYQAYTGPGLFPPLALLIPTLLFTTGAVLRLAWFTSSEIKGYVGATTPITASIILTLYFIHIFYPTFPGSGPILGNIMKYVIPFALILLPYLNVCRYIIYGEDVRSRENKRLMILLLIFMGLGFVSAILAFFPHAKVGPIIYVFCVSIFVMLICYLGIGLYNFFKSQK